MKEEFRNYLIDRGYKQFTPSGNPSTVYDYLKRIESIIIWENYRGWEDIAEHIGKLCHRYSEVGEKAKLGALSHNSVISALRRFREFVDIIKELDYILFLIKFMGFDIFMENFRTTCFEMRWLGFFVVGETITCGKYMAYDIIKGQFEISERNYEFFYRCYGFEVAGGKQ